MKTSNFFGIYRITEKNEAEIEEIICSDEIGYMRDNYSHKEVAIWFALFRDGHNISCAQFIDENGHITFCASYMNESISTDSLRETIMRLDNELNGGGYLSTILNMPIFPNYETPEDTRLFSCVWLPENYPEGRMYPDGLYPASFFTEDKGYNESDLNKIRNICVGNVWAETEIGASTHFVTRVK